MAIVVFAHERENQSVAKTFGVKNLILKFRFRLRMRSLFFLLSLCLLSDQIMFKCFFCIHFPGRWSYRVGSKWRYHQCRCPEPENRCSIIRSRDGRTKKELDSTCIQGYQRRSPQGSCLTISTILV